jgi:methanogenic corrinoid protein MtbC1
MLRLGSFDPAGEDGGGIALSSALISRAIGDLANERAGDASAGFVVEQLCAALVEDAPSTAQAYVDRLIDCGVGVDAFYETYIPRAAARLGEMWTEDRLGFTAVTLGMTRLTETFRRLSPAFLRDRPAARTGGRRALFALVPGETHALGVVMAADYFQRRGWSVRVELRSDPATLARLVRDQPFDVIGFSAGSRRMLPGLEQAVARLRDASPSHARILVGGPIVALDPDVADRVGADYAGPAARLALAHLENDC